MAVILPEKPTLSDYQAYMKKAIKELGFESETVSDIFLLLMEETGEFAKAARKSTGIQTHPESKTHDVAEEAADLFWYLLDLCNHLGVDLEKVFRNKAAKNQKRQWQ